MRSEITRVAALQLRVTSSRSDNLARAAALIARAASEGASFVALPEVFTGSYGVDHFAKWQEEVPEGYRGMKYEAWETSLSGAAMMAEESLRHGITVTGGVVERGDDGHLFNSMPIYKDGILLRTYRKVHLSRVLGVTSESDVFTAGDAPCSVGVPSSDGGGFELGMACCFDLRFPAFLGLYGPHVRREGPSERPSKGVDAICAPSAFLDVTGGPHWDLLLRRTALDQQAYVIAPNVAYDGSNAVPLHGRSAICDPWGDIVAQCSAAGDDIAIAEMSAARLSEVRSKLPLEALCRLDV